MILYDLMQFEKKNYKVLTLLILFADEYSLQIVSLALGPAVWLCCRQILDKRSASSGVVWQ